MHEIEIYYYYYFIYSPRIQLVCQGDEDPLTVKCWFIDFHYIYIYLSLRNGLRIQAKARIREVKSHPRT